MNSRSRRAMQGSAALAAGLIQRAYRSYVGRNPMPVLPGGGKAKRPPYRAPRLRGRKAPVVASRRVVVRPRRINCVVGQLSQSQFRLTARPSLQVKSLKRIASPNITVKQFPFQVPIPFGFQDAFSVSLYNVQMLLDILATVPTASGTGSKRCVIENAISELTMTNSSNTSAELEIWDLVLKKDLQHLGTFTVNGLTYPVGPDPQSYWKAGSAASEGSAASVVPNPATFIGSSPFDSVLFKDYFKVMKRTLVMLPQGSTHRHSVNLKPNKMVDQFMTPASTGGIPAFGGIRGITQFTMVNIKGVPISDTDSGTTTTSSVLIDVLQSLRLKHTWVADNTQTGYYTDNLTTPSAVDTAIINVGSGAIDQAKTA